LLRAVFRLALRQTKGLIGSVIRLPGLDLPVPDHTTLSRRADGLDVPPLPRVLSRPRSDSGAEAVHLLVDRTGLELCGAGEWLLEKHGTKTRRSWRKLHIEMDAETGEFAAAELTTNNADDAFQVGPLGQMAEPVASFTGDGAYDQDSVYRTVADHQPEAVVIVPPRATAVASGTARPNQPSALAIFNALPRKAGLGGSRRRATTSAAWPRRASASGSARIRTLPRLIADEFGRLS
jgi:hypothetical protein